MTVTRAPLKIVLSRRQSVYNDTIESINNILEIVTMTYIANNEGWSVYNERVTAEVKGISKLYIYGWAADSIELSI